MLRIPLFVIAAVGIGALIGLVAGDDTVNAIRSDVTATEQLAGAYGVPVKTDPFAAPVEPIDELEANSVATVAIPAEDPAGCIACSDWEMGYRWAERRDLRRVSACRVDSWSFQRGCEAAIRDRALDAA